MSDFQDESQALPGLIGDECDEVWFVRDYVIVILSNAQIQCIANPKVELDGVTFAFPEPGSRDALCSLIDRTVVSAVQLDNGPVEVNFSGGAKLSVSPADFPYSEFIFIAGRPG